MTHTKKFLRNSLTAVAAAALLLSAGDASATGKKKKMSGKARAAFDKGDNTIAVGLGLGSVYTYANASFLPGATVSFDHGTFGNVGPGTIGLGATFSYVVARYKYGSYTDTWSNFVIGARGTYHLTILKDKNNKFDPYAGVTVGVRAYSYKDDLYDNTSSSVYPFIGPFVGAKYNFVPSFGAWAEVGYDVSALRLGINFNF